MGSNTKKNAKLNWVELENGHYILSKNKALNISLNTTDEINSKDLSISYDSYPSFIKNSTFYGEVIAKQESDVKLNDRMRDTIVEVNPHTMQLCGMQIGSPVLMSQDFESDSTLKLAYRSWPSTNVPLGKVGLSEKQLKHLHLSVGNFLYLGIPQQNCVNAQSAELQPMFNTEDRSSFYSSEHFRTYISTIFDRMYVISGQLVEVHYFGKPFQFKITNIESSTCLDNTQPTTNSSSDKVEEQFSALSLSNCEVTPPLHVSTPLKQSSIPANAKTPCKNLQTSVLEAKHCQVFMLTSRTLFKIIDNQTNSGLGEEKSDFKKPCVNFGCIGGLQEQIQTIRDLTVMPLQNPEIFADSGIRPIRGILLHGPPGTGKSLLAQSVATEANAKMIFIRGAEIMSRFLGESEKQLQSIFKKAKQSSSCVIVMDEVDTLCPKRETSRTDAERRIVASLINILDELNSASENSRIVVIATTNRLESVDPALRRAGRFDREIEIGIPSAAERFEILKKLLSKSKHSISEKEIKTLAESAHGYVGADLAAVCVEAGMSAIKRLSQKVGSGESPSPCITADDVEAGLKLIPPSAMRELIVEVPKVRWSDIGGNENIKKKLKHAIEWPLKNPEAFTRLGIEPPRGLLMFGPPGCSKTLTAKALATESGLNFISIKGPELFSKFVGDSERAIRQIFSKARSAAPSIIFFDELDALAIERGSGNAVADRVLAAMLTEMDGVERRRDVIVVAATNRPDMIDKALLRPGRIDRILHIPLPDENTRREIFRIRFRKMPITDDVNMDWLVASTKMYSGAEICSVCREAALAALDDDMQANHVTRRHFEQAFKVVLPQTSKGRAEMYEEYGRTLQTRIK
uniref:Spermatogenesis-associated protein 5 n=1 Tax=Phallusia mammillata TaxID=59560 RepID=A0A6F9DU31_9ASCI|nr:spermatogenesis-associated protein 5 [Phallusia mammillata]